MAAAGVNVTLKVQLPKEGMTVWQLSVSEKSGFGTPKGSKIMLLSVTGLAVLLMTVTVSGALVVPTVCTKLRLGAFTVIGEITASSKE